MNIQDIREKIARDQYEVSFYAEIERYSEDITVFITIVLSRELSGLGLTEIAETFKIPSYKTVGTACFRLKKKMEENIPRYLAISLSRELSGLTFFNFLV